MILNVKYYLNDIYYELYIIFLTPLFIMKLTHPSHGNDRVSSPVFDTRITYTIQRLRYRYLRHLNNASSSA